MFDLGGHLCLRVRHHNLREELLLRDISDLDLGRRVRRVLDHVEELLPEGVEVDVLVQGLRDDALLAVSLQGVLLCHDLGLALLHVRQRISEDCVQQCRRLLVRLPRAVRLYDVELHAHRAAHELRAPVATLAPRLLHLVHPAARRLNNRSMLDPEVLAVCDDASPGVDAVDAIAPAIPVLVELLAIQDHLHREVIGPILLHVTGLEHILLHRVNRIPHLIENLVQKGGGIHPLHWLRRHHLLALVRRGRGVRGELDRRLGTHCCKNWCVEVRKAPRAKVS
mmetsp:Transcript_30463/g.77565  ORF Transcript_30463/g.77565 Transcript_30463/m.77565 type:complete len:281 (-) Transcript_30463:30-872(-)